MVEASNTTIFKDKINWIKCAIRGALSLSNEALIDGAFKDEMKEKLESVYGKIETFDSISSTEDINKFFPMLDEE